MFGKKNIEAKNTFYDLTFYMKNNRNNNIKFPNVFGVE